MTMCTCSVHCPESPYHESACCSATRCGCWCHYTQREIDQWNDALAADRICSACGDRNCIKDACRRNS